MEHPKCPSCGKQYVWDWCGDSYRTAAPPHFHCIEDEIQNPGTALVVKAEYKVVQKKPEDDWFMNDRPLESANVMRCITPKCEALLGVALFHPDMGEIVCNIPAWAEVDWEVHTYETVCEPS